MIDISPFRSRNTATQTANERADELTYLQRGGTAAPCSSDQLDCPLTQGYLPIVLPVPFKPFKLQKTGEDLP